jgi:hypothetical protein
MRRTPVGGERPERGSRVIPAILLGVILLGGCGDGEESTPPPAAEPEYDGLTREQIELQAEPMTPAEAERLGIVDTTIRIEAPVSPDSLPAESIPPP